MDSKIHLIAIQQKEPLSKRYKTVHMSEMTWDAAFKKTSEYLSPTVASGATGTAVSVRVGRWGKNDWIYIPRW